jgi:hypothetical protein
MQAADNQFIFSPVELPQYMQELSLIAAARKGVDKEHDPRFANRRFIAPGR